LENQQADPHQSKIKLALTQWIKQKALRAAKETELQHINKMMEEEGLATE
jgi:hypothetical protein